MNPGELLDRTAILTVKVRMLGERPEIVSELKTCTDQLKYLKEASEYLAEFIFLNEQEWKENEVIFEAARNEFPNEKKELKRILFSVFEAHKLNMKRVTLKNSVNAKLGCKTMEIKSWQ